MKSAIHPSVSVYSLFPNSLFLSPHFPSPNLAIKKWSESSHTYTHRNFRTIHNCLPYTQYCEMYSIILILLFILILFTISVLFFVCLFACFFCQCQHLCELSQDNLESCAFWASLNLTVFPISHRYNRYYKIAVGFPASPANVPLSNVTKLNKTGPVGRVKKIEHISWDNIRKACIDLLVFCLMNNAI